jgi:hypothetical protein
MNKEIFITTWTERQRYENELMMFADKEIKEFNGTTLMSWFSDKKTPILDNNFVNSLSKNNKKKLKNLIKSLQ